MIIKRSFDIFVSFLSIILLFPILILISLAIKIDSRGSIFFRQDRVGKDMKIFRIWKFRTMKVNSDPYGDSPNSDSDKRITSFGRLLREYSLDELPQLFNVLTGSMSLVGPRPIYNSLAQKLDKNQKKRFIVKPGITGLAQVKGRTNLTWDQRIEYDCRYVENCSLFNDIIILFKTISVLFISKNIYEIEASLEEHGIGNNIKE
tara:strand:- start:1503 stop:2114 length:612 start_codon:yes stop_codon:yes gene_type:complete